MKGYRQPIAIIVLILFLDQFLKTWVKTRFLLGEELKVFGNWFIIHFTENNGMAFGVEFGGEIGKLCLSIFRVLAVAGIGYGLHYLIKNKYHKGLIAIIAMIFAGAMGNIIDSVFYGKIYGYEKIFHGRVVDMLYFPLIDTHFPSWVPIWGGEELIFFRAVFNVADASISVGVVLLLIFQKKFFKQHTEATIQEDEETVIE